MLKTCLPLSYWFSLFLLTFAPLSIAASTQLEFKLTLRDHLFQPSVVYIPAGQKVRLIIQNLDDSPEEFESFSMNREKVILGKSQGQVFIGPLKAGRYPFYGEYNPDSAKGEVVVLSSAQWQRYQETGNVD